jgi:hypothetical protein
MQYVHIIALIDAYLERLTQARLLLTTLDPSLERDLLMATPPPARPRKQRADVRDNSRTPVLRSGERGIAPRQKTKPSVPEKPAKKTAKKTKTVVHSENASVPIPSEPALVPNKPVGQEQPRGYGAGALIEEQSALTQRATAPRLNKARSSGKRPAPSKPPVAQGTMALGGLVPAGPIFIPAKQIRDEQSLRQRESHVVRDVFSPPTAVPLTVELLSQRWLRGSAS